MTSRTAILALVGTLLPGLGCTTHANECTPRPPPKAAVPPPCIPGATAASSAAQERRLIWDGEDPSSSAKGWASCDDKGHCSVTLNSEAGAGHGGSKGLVFRARAKQWAGFGWNWFGWHPDNAGTDISKYKSLTFKLRVEAAPGKQKPPTEALQVSLNGSSKGGKDRTAAVPLSDYAQDYLDGAWHEIVIPLEPLLQGEGQGFDTTKAWAVDIGGWSAEECDYQLSLDDIAFL